MKPKSGNFPPKDGGWGWFVVLGAAIFAFLTRGYLRTFSIIFEEIRQKFGSSASATAWVYSVNVTISLCSGPISTMLSTRFSVRKVALAGSLFMFLGFLASAYAPSLHYIYLAYAVAGFGQGLLSTPSVLIITDWFDKRRARAMSLALMTDGFGVLAMAPFLQYLLDNFGYSGTMLIVSAIMANQFVTAALYRKPDKLDYADNPDVLEYLRTARNDDEHDEQVEIELKNTGNGQHVRNSDDQEKDAADKDQTPDLVAHEPHQKDFSQRVLKYFDYRLLGMGRYLTFCLLMLCASLCFSMCNTHIAGLAIESKMTTSQISLLISSMGGLSIISKLLSGFLFDNARVRKFRVHLFSALGAIIGTSLLTSPWIQGIAGFYMLWLLYATAAGAFTTQESIILADIVGRDRFSSAIGINRFFRGIGVLIGPTVGGFLKDYTQVYDYTFIFGGLCFLSSLTLFELSIIFVKNRRNKI